MAVTTSPGKLMRSVLLMAFCATGFTANANPLPLWEIQGANNRIFLLGSVHFLRPTDYPLPAGMEAAYASADELVMEIDLDDLDPVEAQTVMSSMAIDGDDLRTGIGSAAFTEAQELAVTAGIQLEPLAPFEPWFAALMITQMRMLQMGFDPAWGVETKFSERARQDGKPIQGLETLAEQLSFMDELDADTQKLFLLESLQDVTAAEAEVEAMMTAWHAGDMAAIADQQAKMRDEAPHLYDALFTQRNRNWVPQIIELTKQQQNYLVIVGAGHLAGDDSVLEMLKAKGISVRQLSDTTAD